MAYFLSKFVILCSLIYLNVPVMNGLVTIIDINVEGYNVVKSGVRQYTLYGSSSGYFRINCALTAAVQPSETIILEDGREPGGENPTQRNSDMFTTIWSSRYEKPESSLETNNLLMKYTCRASFLVPLLAAVNESKCHSTIDSEVEVKFESYLVASTVGLSVYAGEQISIFCKGTTSYDYYDTCDFQEGRSNTYVTRVPINGLAKGHIYCEWGVKRWYEYNKCFNIEPIFQFTSHLQLSLTPFNFTYDGSTLEFNCTSFPPRLMRWTIITANGDILDFSSYDVIKVSINTTITQRPGETILNIKEASPGGNDILAVRCSSYDTLAHVVITSHRVVTEDNDVKTTVTQTPKTTAEKDAYQTTAIQPVRNVTGSPNDCNVSKNSEAKGKNCQTNMETMYAIVIAITVTMTSIVCILIVALIILCRKLERATIHHAPPTSHDKDCSMEAPSATELHHNPVYMSYSETNDVSIPNDEEQNDTCTYINI